SLIENGKREPRLGQLGELATAVGVSTAELLLTDPPTRRDGLEIELERRQRTPEFIASGLPEVKPTIGMTDEVLERIIAMHRLIDQPAPMSGPAAELRKAAASVAGWLSDHDGYLSEVERVAGSALDAIGYAGNGPLASSDLNDIAAWTGFRVRTVDEIPRNVRSVVDHEDRLILIARRNELRVRQARKAILQTLAGILLDHERPDDAETLLRQRVESAYFAAAVLAPERAALPQLESARRSRELSVEDLEDRFNLSYEMAAWRFVNLATRHLGIRSHLATVNLDGIIWKGYGNDDVPFPTDPAGSFLAQRACRHWAARTVFDSDDRYGIHPQYTDTPDGTFFCVSRVDPERSDSYSVTIGVGFDDARWFRERATERRGESFCPDGECCRHTPSELAARWRGKTTVSARSQDRLIGLLAPDPEVGIDFTEVYELLSRETGP
ncbi:MAG: ImmA/IrrE family metallo-endopeptidase, partial [Acidimicrobiia bacterium]|nr:ImmA/IrrE family metallo-endopeptidase [Acidimicrobiia bacterium]